MFSFHFPPPSEQKEDDVLASDQRHTNSSASCSELIGGDSGAARHKGAGSGAEGGRAGAQPSNGSGDGREFAELQLCSNLLGLNMTGAPAPLFHGTVRALSRLHTLDTAHPRSHFG
ncbi:unnamed protein product [Pleuronectes platessa]|uniref:Uncharacterized protein n=1 Tax=Pleuronectes platessa TaxID=8262 RepID=A0A9N7Z4Z6_PLEPL|nr:unnamed protein product [Pleuronectes platessa]